MSAFGGKADAIDSAKKGPLLTQSVSGGADFFAHGNASLRVAYDGRFGDDVEVHSGSVRGRLEF